MTQPWSAAEDAELRALYPDHSGKEIGELLGRTTGSVRNRSWRLSLNSRKAPLWSDAELQRLIDAYTPYDGAHVPLDALAKSMGRPKCNVCTKAKALGLTQQSGRIDPDKKWADGRWKTLRKYATREEAKRAGTEAMKATIAKNGHPRGALGMKHTDEAKRKMKEATDRWHASASQEQKDAARRKAKLTTLARYGTGNPSMRGQNGFSRCKGGRRADLGDCYFRSAWEANYARYLNFLLQKGEITAWEYEPKTFIFHGVTRGALTYTPDFLITEKDGRCVWHEVKGWMTSESKTRLKRMAKHYPEEMVILIQQPEYKAISQYAGLIEGWE